MELRSLDIIISRLREASKPLPVDNQHKLADWLEQYRALHDGVLWSDCALQITKEPEQSKML